MVLQTQQGGGGTAGGRGTVNMAQHMPACDCGTVSAAQHMLPHDHGTVEGTVCSTVHDST